MSDAKRETTSIRPHEEGLEEALADAIDFSQPYSVQREALVARSTRHYLRAVLHLTRGNRTEAAHLSGLDRGYFRLLVLKHDVLPPEDDVQTSDGDAFAEAAPPLVHDHDGERGEA